MLKQVQHDAPICSLAFRRSHPELVSGSQIYHIPTFLIK